LSDTIRKKSRSSPRRAKSVKEELLAEKGMRKIRRKGSKVANLGGRAQIFFPDEKDDM